MGLLAKVNSKDYHHPLIILKIKALDMFRTVEGLKIMRAEEAIHEQNRLMIFRAHVSTINTAIHLSGEDLLKQISALKPLVQPLPRFRNASEIGLPLFEERSLLHTVLETTQLCEENKCKLLYYLFQIGYKPFYNILLSPPLLEIILLNQEFKTFLRDMYLNQLQPSGIKSQLELRIWDSLLSENINPNELFSILFIRLKTDHLLQFIECWMRSINNKNTVITTYASIERFIQNTAFNRYKPHIKKIAQIRILAIELNKNFMGEDDYIYTTPIDETISKQDPVKRFLKSSALPLFLNFFTFHPSSYAIYKEIQENKLDTSDKFSVKNNRVAQRINKKLMDDLGHPYNFILRP